MPFLAIGQLVVVGLVFWSAAAVAGVAAVLVMWRGNRNDGESGARRATTGCAFLFLVGLSLSLFLAGIWLIGLDLE